MNKQELIDAVAAETGASKAQTGETLDTLLEVIKTAVSKGDAVQLIGFGSFGSGKRAARTGRNPKTGETIKIPAAKTVKFTAGKAFKDADVIYAKSWGPLLTTADKNEGKKIQDSYKHWITDEAKMKLAKPDAIYMHPLPADHNIEVTEGVIDGMHSVVYDEAENRLHAQKAVMALTM